MTNEPQPKPFNMAAFANAVLASQFPERPATVEPFTRCRYCSTIVTRQRHIARRCCGKVDCLLADVKRAETSFDAAAKNDQLDAALLDRVLDAAAEFDADKAAEELEEAAMNEINSTCIES